MTKVCSIPDSLQAGFKIPVYPAPQLPTTKALQAVQQWMLEHGLLQQPLPYDRLVPAALQTQLPLGGNGAAGHQGGGVVGYLICAVIFVVVGLFKTPLGFISAAICLLLARDAYIKGMGL